MLSNKYHVVSMASLVNSKPCCLEDVPAPDQPLPDPVQDMATNNQGDEQDYDLLNSQTKTTTAL